MFLINLPTILIAALIATLAPIALLIVALIKRCKQGKTKIGIPHILAAYILCFILVVIFLITGIPSITDLTLDAKLNLIPIINIFQSNFRQYIQNIILFIPLGFLLPLLWSKFEKISKTFLAGALLSVGIEITQLFTSRITDIDDLIMNTIGTIAGYLLFMLIKKVFPKIKVFSSDNNAGREVFICFAITWLAMFIVNPFISSMIR